jgi:hypothetical protein
MIRSSVGGVSIWSGSPIGVPGISLNKAPPPPPRQRLPTQGMMYPQKCISHMFLTNCSLFIIDENTFCFIHQSHYAEIFMLKLLLFVFCCACLCRTVSDPLHHGIGNFLCILSSTLREMSIHHCFLNIHYLCLLFCIITLPWHFSYNRTSWSDG